MNELQTRDVTIEDRSLSRNGLILVGGSIVTVVASVGIAVAVARVSTGLMWAAIILSVGAACNMVLSGIGVFVQQRFAGRAMLERAKAEAKARLMEARHG